MKPSLSKAPIIFIGMPRSGTTILFEAFAQHRDLGWLSNYSQQFPNMPWLNFVRCLHDNPLFCLRAQKKQYQKVLPFNRFLAMPNEAYDFWDWHTGQDFSFHFLSDKTADEDIRSRVQNACATTVRVQGRKRLATKLTGPPRVHFLHSIFPDARFVHVVRNGFAVVHSLMRVPFWEEKGGFEGPFWKGGLAEDEVNEWRDNGADPAIITAMQWRHVLKEIRRESSALPVDHYTEVRYESFVENPHAELTRLYRQTGLDDCVDAHNLLDAKERLQNMNHKYLSDWSEDKIAQLGSVMEPLLSEYGYAR
ncbi:sulfotransferase family protein [Desulfovibrio inopinatus]|uniref:sulfotransferase family protein n=1 Tax=Desulfovibrio inopinatus TaxID=102109 RepID=UPI00068657C5|nr:sulfotransferase [Desulfovibrio inopinatus]